MWLQSYRVLQNTCINESKIIVKISIHGNSFNLPWCGWLVSGEAPKGGQGGNRSPNESSGGALPPQHQTSIHCMLALCIVHWATIPPQCHAFMHFASYSQESYRYLAFTRNTRGLYIILKEILWLFVLLIIMVLQSGCACMGGSPKCFAGWPRPPNQEMPEPPLILLQQT